LKLIAARRIKTMV